MITEKMIKHIFFPIRLIFSYHNQIIKLINFLFNGFIYSLLSSDVKSSSFIFILLGTLSTLITQTRLHSFVSVRVNIYLGFSVFTLYITIRVSKFSLFFFFFCFTVCPSCGYIVTFLLQQLCWCFAFSFSSYSLPEIKSCTCAINLLSLL